MKVEMNMSTPGIPNAMAGPRLAQKDRHQQRREERSEVDDPVERVEDDLRAMLVGLVELVADERRHARFDAAGPERDQRKPDVEADPVRYEQREAELPDAINQAEPEDGVVFPKKPVGQPPAEQRKKINADDEGMKYILCRARPIPLGQIGEERRDQEHRQDVAHPVKAEALAAFVADDVADLARDSRVWIRHHRDVLHGRERRLPADTAQLQRG